MPKLWAGLILTTFLVSTYTLTSLSTTQCPSNFDVASANTTGTSVSAAVDFLYANLYSSSEQAQIQAAFYSGDSGTVNSKIMSLSILIPFALIGCAFLITYIILVCCCIFEKSCPPCKSWKRDFAARPY